MNVQLIAHTQLSDSFIKSMSHDVCTNIGASDGEIISLIAIRNCYSHLKPSEIVNAEAKKYFNTDAKDGGNGTDANRLFRQIVNSKHTSTLEHINYTFAIEGVSRALLAQLTRHRHFSYSVKSQRYVKYGSEDKSGGFDYVTPYSVTSDKLINIGTFVEDDALNIFNEAMADAQSAYDRLREAGVPAEDARMVLPQSATCDIVLTGNLRSILEFYNKRKKGNGAQAEIAELAESMKNEVVNVDTWAAEFFS